MQNVTLITGGSRSGKSDFAEKRTLSYGMTAYYIATAQILDEEMADRVHEHQKRRSKEWITIAEPYDIVDQLTKTDGQGARLVDCLTLWLSNLMLSDMDWQNSCDVLIDCLSRQTTPVVLVTNEVGSGIVPENALARSFRDAQGIINRKVASIADEVYLVVAGYPVTVKVSNNSSNYDI